MSLLINSYEMRPPAVTLGGMASLWLGGAGAMTDTEFKGIAAMVFGQSAALKAGKAMAGLAELRMQQVAALIAGVVPMSGSAGMGLNTSALLRAALLLEGDTGLVLGQTGTLRKGGQMSALTALVLAQAANLRARQELTGESILTAGEAAALVCDYGTVADPVISPSYGSPTYISNGQTITITTSTPVAQIFWTRDGADPVVEQDEEGVWTSPNGTLYTGGFPASIAWGTFTLKAVATKQNWEPSALDSQLYNFVA